MGPNSLGCKSLPFRPATFLFFYFSVYWNSLETFCARESSGITKSTLSDKIKDGSFFLSPNARFVFGCLLMFDWYVCSLGTWLSVILQYRNAQQNEVVTSSSATHTKCIIVARQERTGSQLQISEGDFSHYQVLPHHCVFKLRRYQCVISVEFRYVSISVTVFEEEGHFLFYNKEKWWISPLGAQWASVVVRKTSQTGRSSWSLALVASYCASSHHFPRWKIPQSFFFLTIWNFVWVLFLTNRVSFKLL